MALGSTFALGTLAAAGVAAGVTQYLARRMQARYPPIGQFADVNGVRLHFIEESSCGNRDEAPVIFLHGAGGNARDLRSAISPNLKGIARAIFVDRPGAGYSDSLPLTENASVERQGDIVVGLMDRLGVAQAIVVGHSFGGAVALAMALNHRERVASLLLAAPATHPWPDGRLSWYYRIAQVPVVGRLFIETLVIPIGHLLYRPTVRKIFEPNAAPPSYFGTSATGLILRPGNFASNARDIAALYRNLARLSQRYREITVPTTIVTGDSDGVVAPHQHAYKLAAALPHARLVVLANTGHMPLHVRPELIADEIRRLSLENTRNVRTDMRRNLSA